MKYLAILALVVLAGCDNRHEAPPKLIMSYEELEHFKADCNYKNTQQKVIMDEISFRNLDRDPDTMTDDERKFNSRLKSTYWWLEFNCGDNK